MEIKEQKVNVKNNYGYFAMDTATVRKELNKPFEELRLIMNKKNMIGRLLICRFNDFDGNFEYTFVICLLIFLLKDHT